MVAQPIRCYLDGMMHVPLRALTAVEISAIKAELTIQYQPMGAEVAQVIEAYDITDRFIAVPRQYGLMLATNLGLEVVDRTTSGRRVEFPGVVKARGYQVPILSQLCEHAEKSFDFMFKAHTGWGKTIGVLLVAQYLGLSTCVVVDQENLKKQWIDACAKFGVSLEAGNLGEYQGKKRDFQGKTVVIAMVQTLTRTDQPPEFWDEFGLVICDEVHSIGAPTFSEILMYFNATIRIGASATPVRTDGLQKLLEWSLGGVDVVAEKQHKASTVFFAKSDTVYGWYANVSKNVGRIITEVTDDGRRNLLVAEATKWLYDTGRDVLVLSDRIEQLRHLESLLYYLGVPEHHAGLIAGFDPFYTYVKEAIASRLPFGSTRYDGDAMDDGLPSQSLKGKFLYSPIGLQIVRKRIPDKREAWVKRKARIVLATYGKCAKGFDEARLNGGVDASPRAAAEQIHGRILRERPPEKKQALWITIQDTNSYRLLNTFNRRMTDFTKSNGVLYEWQENGNLIPCPLDDLLAQTWQRHKELQRMEIQQGPDGMNMLVTPSSVSTQKRTRALATVARIQSEIQSSPEGFSRKDRSANSSTATQPDLFASSPTASPKPRRRLAARLPTSGAG